MDHLADVAEAEDAAGRELAEATPQLGVRVSPSALFLSFGDMRVVPRPVCKTGARQSNGGPIPPSPTAFVHCLRSSIGQSKRLLPVRFQVQLLAGAPLLSPVGNALPTCLAFIQETSRPQVRHGRPFAGVAKQVDAPRPERAAFSQGALQVRILPPALSASRRSSAMARALT